MHIVVPMKGEHHIENAEAVRRYLGNSYTWWFVWQGPGYIAGGNNINCRDEGLFNRGHLLNQVQESPICYLDADCFLDRGIFRDCFEALDKWEAVCPKGALYSMNQWESVDFRSHGRVPTPKNTMRTWSKSGGMLLSRTPLTWAELEGWITSWT